MAVVPTRISVTGTATRLDSVTETDRSSGSRVTLLLQASSPSLVLGGSGAVTAATGARVPVGLLMLEESLSPGEELWGIVATGTLAVDVLETGV